MAFGWGVAPSAAPALAWSLSRAVGAASRDVMASLSLSTVLVAAVPLAPLSVGGGSSSMKGVN